jgi:hypothetical protein
LFKVWLSLSRRPEGTSVFPTITVLSFHYGVAWTSCPQITFFELFYLPQYIAAASIPVKCVADRLDAKIFCRLLLHPTLHCINDRIFILVTKPTNCYTNYCLNHCL